MEKTVLLIILEPLLNSSNCAITGFVFNSCFEFDDMFYLVNKVHFMFAIPPLCLLKIRDDLKYFSINTE